MREERNLFFGGDMESQKNLKTKNERKISSGNTLYTTGCLIVCVLLAYYYFKKGIFFFINNFKKSNKFRVISFLFSFDDSVGEMTSKWANDLQHTKTN